MSARCDNLYSSIHMASSLEKNPFTEPLLMRNIIRQHVNVRVDWRFDGQGFICVLVNTECPVGCPNCMFATIPDMETIRSQRLGHQRISKLLQFVEDSRSRYLLVSGAGEPFLNLGALHEIARNSTAEYTWMVTSGYWASSRDKARVVIAGIYDAFKTRQHELGYRKLFIRLSVDQFHVEKIRGSGSDRFEYLENVISVFENEYLDAPGFSLMLHSLEGEEPLLQQFVNSLGAELVPSAEPGLRRPSMHPIGFHHNTKRTERVMLLKLPSGNCLEVTFAKKLLSDLSAPLDDSDLPKRVAIFDRDAYINEAGNPAVKRGEDGSIGPNILVSFDGSISMWQSEMPDVNLSLDTHDYSDFESNVFSDPGVLATIEKGLKYRFDVIAEVNPKAVLQSKAVNLRDYTSRVLLEEDRVKLYYTVRALKDYIDCGRVDEGQRKHWPVVLKQLLALTNTDLQELYRSSGYDIIRQTMDTEGEDFRAFVSLVNSVESSSIDSVVDMALEAGLLSDRALAERCYILFLRISRGWYGPETLSVPARLQAYSIANALGRLARKTWRGHLRVEA